MSGNVPNEEQTQRAAFEADAKTHNEHVSLARYLHSGEYRQPEVEHRWLKWKEKHMPAPPTPPESKNGPALQPSLGQMLSTQTAAQVAAEIFARQPAPANLPEGEDYKLSFTQEHLQGVLQYACSIQLMRLVALLAGAPA